MEPISIRGYVTDNIQRNKDNVLFIVKGFDEVHYKVLYEGFCPLYPQDAIYLSKCSRMNNGVYKALVPPFVTILDDRSVVEDCFVKILRGTNFGKAAATKLYDHLYTLATSLNKKLSVFLDSVSSEYCDTSNKDLIKLVCEDNTKRHVISLSQTSKLLTEWYNKRGLRKLYLLGLTKGEILRANVDLDKLYDIALANPYRIASIPLKKCETLLKILDNDVSDLDRICGKINRYVYDQTFNQGHTCVKESEIRKRFPHFDHISELLFKDYFLMMDGENIYMEKIYEIESNVLSYITHLVGMNNPFYRTNGPRIDQDIYDCKTLTDEQKSAIEGALHYRISIVTGGAGTGKSEIIKEICKNLNIREQTYNVCAFTGKAVAKLHSVMKNDDATTIDRLILDIRKMARKIPSHIIIDEGSMVTIELFQRLIKAIELRPIRITIVGDCNQLPPIGYGNLMKELIISEKIPVFTLMTNQRIKTANNEEKTILENANALIDPERNPKTPVKFKEGNGFYILSGGLNTVGHIINALRNSNVSMEDILILSPYRMFLEELNSTVQETYLQDSFKYEQDIPGGQRRWRVGDRVMMTKNNYSIKIMNGQQGEIKEISKEGLKVEFGGIQYIFGFDEIKAEDKEDDPDEAKKDDDEEPLLSSDLLLSYAVSIHKSQGSEADYVILFIEERNTSFSGSSNFLNINLLYTAITRTRKTIWIVSEKDVLEKVSITPLIHKNDGLAARLKNNF
jgi:hypothetical protein